MLFLDAICKPKQNIKTFSLFKSIQSTTTRRVFQLLSLCYQYSHQLIWIIQSSYSLPAKFLFTVYNINNTVIHNQQYMSGLTLLPFKYLQKSIFRVSVKAVLADFIIPCQINTIFNLTPLDFHHILWVYTGESKCQTGIFWQNMTYKNF